MMRSFPMTIDFESLLMGFISFLFVYTFVTIITNIIIKYKIMEW
jgi:hypothetical protein